MVVEKVTLKNQASALVTPAINKLCLLTLGHRLVMVWHIDSWLVRILGRTVSDAWMELPFCSCQSSKRSCLHSLFRDRHSTCAKARTRDIGNMAANQTCRNLELKIATVAATRPVYAREAIVSGWLCRKWKRCFNTWSPNQSVCPKRCMDKLKLSDGHMRVHWNLRWLMALYIV